MVQVIQVLYLPLNELDALEQILLLVVGKIQPLLAVFEHLGRVLVVVNFSNDPSFIRLLDALHLLLYSFHISALQEQDQRVQISALQPLIFVLLKERLNIGLEFRSFAH